MLRWIGRHGPAADPPPEQAFPWQGQAYAGRSKLEALFGPGIWAEVAGKVVVEFGCTDGAEAIAMAAHGARKVIGIDNRESVLQIARQAAAARGVADRCVVPPRLHREGADPMAIGLQVGRRHPVL